MSNDLTFSIRSIFDVASTEGVLQQNGAKKYYIAPYQRGYKWASSSPNDAVCVLISDLIDAAKDQDSEYYLQFITTKKSIIKEEPVLEVIDGQQRLTTLTVLLSVLEHIKGDNEKAISDDLLLYEVRPKVTVFFQEHIYKNLGMLMSDTWEGFIKKYPENDEQDIYYLFSAANKINEMLQEEFYKDSEDKKAIDKNAVLKFKTYLLENVKIILNHITSNIDCEEIFSNLNDNRVELTSSDLIKGLILTKAARETPNTENKITYKERMELRAIIGRQWDEISHWANREEIKIFYFPGPSNVLDKLLSLLALDNGLDKTNNISNKNAEFNYFQSEIKNGGKTASELFDNLKVIKSVLNEWFYDKKIYNSLGYVFFCRKFPKKSIDDYVSFIRNDRPILEKELRKTINNILNFDIDELQYYKNNTEIYDLLLALNVFRDENSFNFTAFNTQFWTLEHIFPQTPDELEDKLGEKDILLLNSLCDKKLNYFEKVKDKLQEYEETMNIKDVYKSLSEKMSKKTCTLNSEEKTVLYRLIKIDNEKLQSIGNMTLLTRSDNSSNGNGMFDKKRYNIVKRISKGSFVPKHTYDVFSKLISEKMTPDLTVWMPIDIDEHFEWIKDEINKIKSAEWYEER